MAPVTVLGCIATGISVYVVLAAKRIDVFMFLLGTQFLRAVLRIDLGTITNLSFLMFCCLAWVGRFCIFERKKFHLYELIPFILLIWDSTVSISYGTMRIGDNILWTFSLLVMLDTILADDDFCIDDMALFFGLAVWSVCLINVLAEISLFGTSLLPSLYGVYFEGNFFSFGKAYASVAGGNGIVLITLIGIAMFSIILVARRESGYRIFYIISIIAFTYFGFICVARAFYIEITLFLILFVLSQVSKPSKLLICTCVIAIAGGVAFYFFDEITLVLEAAIRRFDEGNEDRVELLSKAKAYLGSSPLLALFGAGSYYPERFYFTAHNMFYDVLMSLGCASFLYISVIAIAIYNTFRRVPHMCFLAMIPLIIFITYKQISGSLRDIPFYFTLTMVLIFYRKLAANLSESKSCHK